VLRADSIASRVAVENDTTIMQAMINAIPRNLHHCQKALKIRGDGIELLKTEEVTSVAIQVARGLR